MSALSSATHPALVPPGHGSRMPINPGRSRLTSSDSGPRAQHQLDTFIRAAVGPYQVTRNASQAHGTARIVVIQADAGARFVVKQHADPAAGRRELRAYRHWVPALAGQAPQLCAADDELHALVLTFATGDPGRADTAAQLEAGALLRRFHDSEPPQSRNRFVPRILEELTDALERGPHLFDAEETQFVQAQIHAWEGSPTPELVPCHLDYVPRNWLMPPDRAELQLIDFAGARRHVWSYDLARLYFGRWRAVPELMDAFLSGYGRPLGGDDLELLRRCVTHQAVRALVRDRQHVPASRRQRFRRIVRTIMDGDR